MATIRHIEQVVLGDGGGMEGGEKKCVEKGAKKGKVDLNSYFSDALVMYIRVCSAPQILKGTWQGSPKSLLILCDLRLGSKSFQTWRFIPTLSGFSFFHFLLFLFSPFHFQLVTNTKQNNMTLLKKTNKQTDPQFD